MATVCGNEATSEAQSATLSPCDTCFSSRQEKLNQACKSGHSAIASPAARASSSDGKVSNASKIGGPHALSAGKDLYAFAMKPDQVVI